MDHIKSVIIPTDSLKWVIFSMITLNTITEYIIKERNIFAEFNLTVGLNHIRVKFLAAKGGIS